jgi:hypothetical protein
MKFLKQTQKEEEEAKKAETAGNGNGRKDKERESNSAKETKKNQKSEEIQTLGDKLQFMVMARKAVAVKTY